MHEKNSFITLTYSDEHLKSPKLVYSDFQKFMKKLRKVQDLPIGVFVTGEYGEQTKRPHWHALLFGYWPSDANYKYSNSRGDRVHDSMSLTKMWGHGIAEVGSLTFESAGYCARYAAKKLVHSPNGKLAEADHHDWQPISKKSSKHAIGKKWLEQYWPDVFNTGQITLPDNRGTCAIPRYYEKWFKENHPTEWLRYVTKIKADRMLAASDQTATDEKIWWQNHDKRCPFKPLLKTRQQQEHEILKSKFKLLQDGLKL